MLSATTNTATVATKPKPLEKPATSPSKPAWPTGILKVLLVLPQLHEFLGVSEASHTDAVKKMCHEFERFSTYLPDLKVVVFYGGINIKDLLKNECPHIVVGTLVDYWGYQEIKTLA